MKPTALKKIAQMMHVSTDTDIQVAGFSVDSRLTSRGDLFFALPGAQTDGHAFIAEAAAKGACAAAVLQSYHGPSYGLSLLRCENTLDALQLLAKTCLRFSKTRIIAITGSLGKTTTKEFLTTILKKKFTVSCSPGNNNSKIGLPLTVLNKTNFDDDLLILEMGMTHPGQISKLIQIAPPSMAIITSVALVHACNFNSIEEIALAKAELFSHSGTELGIYPLDNDFKGILSMRGPCSKVSFSTCSTQADYFLKCCDEDMQIKCPDGDLAIVPLLKLPGEHNRHNFLSAAIAARYLGMTWQEISEALPSLELYERRLQIVEKAGVVFVNDSYNASEMSLKSALQSLPQPASGRKKIAVIGEMTELGKFSQECHRAVGEHALKYADNMLCLGQGCAPIVECWQQAGRPVFWARERADIVTVLRSELQHGDVVLLKGSRPNCLWKVLEEL